MTLTAQAFLDFLIYSLILVVLSPLLWKLANYAEERVQRRRLALAEALHEAGLEDAWPADLGRDAPRRAMKETYAETARMLAELQEFVAANRARMDEVTQAQLERIKADAEQEAQRIVQSAREQAQEQVRTVRLELRDEIASLAVQAAEMILRREVNADEHAAILEKIKSQIR
jgi:F-type H+-transporting ATPase subunit b